ncbi:MAG TPA: acetoacetate decarboxylase family protein [Acidimicrobiia bacterium]|nr:acetoacetate decarboxylase family protein [Acidimicrobiia bacterium]
MTIRYGARPPEQQRNREVEATSAKIWSNAVTIVWETDADAIRAVLPPPLEPSEPHARIRFATVDMGTGIPVFGAGWFGVRARHGSVEGEYPLFMPMTTEQATVGGRETYGEPKKIGGVSIAVDGDHVHARFDRMGFPLAIVDGTLGASIDIPARDKVDFYFKISPSPDGKGFDTEPAFVHVRRHEEAREGRALQATLTLHESPIDPIADIPVGRILSMQYAQIATTQEGEVVERVPADWLLPYVHQRYDDLSVLGKTDK